MVSRPQQYGAFRRHGAGLEARPYEGLEYPHLTKSGLGHLSAAK